MLAAHSGFANVTFLEFFLIVVDVWGIGVMSVNLVHLREDRKLMTGEIEVLLIRKEYVGEVMRLLLLVFSLTVAVITGLHPKFPKPDWVFNLRVGALALLSVALIAQSLLMQYVRWRIRRMDD